MTRLIAILSALLGSVMVSSVYAQSDTTDPKSSPDAAGTSPTEGARVHFKLGVDFYRERNYRAALIEFKRAYNAQPHYKLLYNLGQASLELQEDSAAIDYFTNYLTQGGSDIAEDRRAEIESYITRLQARLADLTVTSNQAGAELYIDDTMIGTLPLGKSIRVSVGRRKLSATKEGFAPVERVIDVAAGDHTTINLEFQKKAEEVDLAKIQSDADARAQRNAAGQGGVSPALITGIATAAVGIGAVTFTVLTMTAQGSYNDERRLETTDAKLDELRTAAKTKALVTDILWGVTAACAVTTAVLILTGDNPDKPPATTGVQVGIGPGNLLVHGHF
ncbi:MAG: hypothetical protein RL701_1080 [Pseudomonadota bacterium]